MEGRDCGSPSMSIDHGRFGAFFHHHQRESGYSLMGNPPSIIHPSAMCRNSVISSTNPNLNSDPNSNCIVPNFNPNAIPNPNQSNAAYFDTNAAAAPIPSIGMMANLGDRSLPEPSSKRKRGRPRKYSKDANGTPSSIPSPSPKPVVLSSVQKKKGHTSGKKAQLFALGPPGQHFTPHILTIASGEDVSTKIITFTSQGPWAVCILSANGAISNATLRHAGVSGGAVTYEGRFEILSLSGSFLLTENNGTRSRTGGLSVSLAGPDGRVIGGGVAGLLMAASPVQVVVGTFFTENRRHAGDGEAMPLVKSPAVQTQPSATIMQQMEMDATETMQDHNLGCPVGEELSHGHYAVPLQSLDWNINHFDMDTRDDTDQATSPGEP